MLLREAVEQAAGRADVRDAVRGIYARLQREIDLRKPACSASGRCCNFDRFGHRLYVTTIELAAFAWQVRDREAEAASCATVAASSVEWDGAGCRYQIDGLCSVHAIRPFGCRVFFCDPTSDEWQHAQYERFHAALKRLHDELNVRYLYVEWRQALRELSLPPAVPRPARPNPLSLPQLPL